MQSLIVEFIRKHKDSWRIEFNKRFGNAIKIREDTNDNYAIFNYVTTRCNFSDPVVKESRGIIVDLTNLRVACWPFTKFFECDESYADNIDWSTARVQEKVDGYIMKLWWNYRHDTWQVSSNTQINADTAFVTSGDRSSTVCLGEMFRAAENYGQINFNHLDRNKTYIFELVVPSNKIIVPYKTVHLYHIGTRSNIDGVETEEFIGVDKPKVYQCGSLVECQKVIEMMELGDNRRLGFVENEGFVVVDGNWKRIKVKSRFFNAMHHCSSGSNESKSVLLWYMYNNKLDVAALCYNYPDLAHIIKYYDYRVTEYLSRARAFIAVIRVLYTKLGAREKVFAHIQANKEYKAIYSKYFILAVNMFKYMGISDAELIRVSINEKILDNAIPKYPFVNFGNLIKSLPAVESGDKPGKVEVIPKGRKAKA